uniref:Sushi, von Willebrand factor type A, EGF and n=1 Tax=Daphnia magna TaxID=35525 RepID=A0A0P5PLV4_9CRUS
MLRIVILMAVILHVLCARDEIDVGDGRKFGYGFTYVRGGTGGLLARGRNGSDAISALHWQADSPTGGDEADDEDENDQDDVIIRPWDDGGLNRLSFQPYIPERKSFKNPRNVPSDSCPRDEDLAQAQGRTCLRKCLADEDCRSPRKKCLCDGICGLSCIKPDRECHDELGNPDKGSVILTGRLFGDRAIYTCEERYRLVGVEFRLCQADGSWSATEPSCHKTVQTSGYCDEPPVVANARHNAPQEQNSFAPDTELQYQCYLGYNTLGFARARCLQYNQTVKWFGPDFKCEARSCGEPTDITNGRHEGECYAFGCRVTYYCTAGFDLVGRANRYCQADGTWTPGELPICVPVQCPIPSDPDLGKAIFSSTSYNSIVSYECLYGNSLVGQPTRRCGPDKRWMGEEPFCREINCGSPGHIPNGWIENLHLGTSLGTSIIYRCNKNMKRIGASSATCEKSGRWSYNPPQCLSSCVVPMVERGVVRNVSVGSMIPHGENLTLECIDLYEPAHGLATFTCNNGTWNVIPRCEPARCKSLPKRPRHGMVIAPRMEHGSRALYKCKDGFQLGGSNVTECNYGNWSGLPPACQEIYCPFPGYIANGKVMLMGNMGYYDYRPYVKKVTNNRQIMYECDRGYKLDDDGPPGATCVAGRWSPKQLPRCVAEQHSRGRWARSIKSGRTPVAIRPGGKKSSGKSTRRKQGSRRNDPDYDDNQQPHESRDTCLPIATESHTSIQVVTPGKNASDMFSTGVVLSITCAEGYRLNVGNRTVRCKRGVWKPERPSCLLIPCTIPDIENAAFQLNDSTIVPANSEIPHNETALFGCNPGYVVQGPEVYRCWFGDFINTRGQTSECVPGPCELPRITYGDYTAGYRAGLTVANGSTVDYVCFEPNYVKINAGPIQCRLGELIPDFPICRTRSDRFGVDDFGRIAWQEFKGGGDITEGGVMVLMDRNKRNCSEPHRVHGSLVFRDGEPKDNEKSRFPHGSQVTFQCISGVNRDRTTWQIVCSDGSWNGRPLNCDGEILIEGLGQPSNKSCIFRNNEPNLMTFYEDQQITEDVVEFPPGTELISRCFDIGKFAFTGSVRRRCSRGDWTGMKPACFGLSQENDYALEKPPTILFRHQLGPIAQSNDGRLIVYPGTIVHMECLWIRRFGTPKWEVSHQYRKYPEGWTEEEGRDRTLEYRLSIFHAQKDDSGTFTCTTPTRHQHSVEIIVHPVHCPAIVERKGLVASTRNTKMGVKVHFSCHNSNSLIGAPELTCLPSGSWSSPTPFCESVLCPDITNITNDRILRVSIVSREVGGRALFSCPPGFTIRGAGTESVCQSSGEWAQPLPRCEEVVCEPPTSPENGYIQGGSTYKAGEVVQFHCHRGFMVEGQPIAVCQDNGKWSGTFPKCLPACPYPGTTIGGTISMVKFYYPIGETVTFDCSTGLVLQGSPNLHCQKGGKWSSAVPTCVPAQNN